MGLTTALVLARRGGYEITVIAKHMPGDYDITYTSPWAGANWLPMAPKTDKAMIDYETITFQELWRLVENDPSAGIHKQQAITYTRDEDVNSAKSVLSGDEFFKEDAWCKDLAPGFRALRKDELPKGYAKGTTFGSVCINTQVYLPWLVGKLLEQGVVVKRGEIKHIKEAENLHHSGHRAGVVVNCTGLMACKLGGVMDPSVRPARGQIVVVRNIAPAMISTSGTDVPGELSYMMTRAAGGGTVIGGTYDIGNWESQPDPNIANRLMTRAVEICPELVKPGQGIEGLEVIRHGVGLRPSRKGGPRIEGEVIEGVKVVHNYGAGGFGCEFTVQCQ